MFPRTWKTELFQSKDWDIWNVLVMQKALVKFKHRKIVFVKVESSVTRNIWKRSLTQTLLV